VALESHRGRDTVVVAHEQEPVMDVGGVVMATEAEAVPAVEPGESGVGAAPSPADIDGIGHGVDPVTRPSKGAVLGKP
jgi:hypothetical protein